MNPIDRIILALSPERGEKRIAARRRAQVLMNYDAASKGRRTNGWKSPRGSADFASYTAREHLRNLARDMIRNRPYAARAADVWVTNVVGTGITPSVDCKNEDQKARVEAILKTYQRTTALCAYGEDTLSAIQHKVGRALFSDGEVLARRRYRNLRLDPDLPLNFQVQLMEVDHLDGSIRSNGKNEVVDGVEVGPTGRIEAYHLLDAHPDSGLSLGTRYRRSTTRVPAQDVIHVKITRRPGQLRGVSLLAAGMMSLGDLSDYSEAQILKQKMAALMALVLKSEDDSGNWTGAGLEELAPGAIVGLPNGYEPHFTDPPKVDGYGEYMKVELRALAGALGLTYEALSGDLEGVNFTSGRMGRIDMDRLIETYQQQVLIGQFCEGIGRWIDDAWRVSTQGEKPQFDIRWTAPRRPMIDPVKETNAAVAQVDAGLNSRQRAQRQMGLDPEVIARERTEDAARDAAEGNSNEGGQGDA